jgi:hypothetical protein
MVHMKSCWSPCFWYNNVVEGSVAVAVYTLAMSICIITYTSYVMNGGDATQLWLPFFETNLNTTTQVSLFKLSYLRKQAQSQPTHIETVKPSFKV